MFDIENKKNLFSIAGVAAALAVALAWFALERSGGRRDEAAVRADGALASIVARVRAAHAMAPDYRGLRESTGEVSIGQGFEAEVSMPGARSFDAVYRDVGRRDCITLLSLETGPDSGLGLIEVRVRNDLGEAGFFWGADGGFPLSPAAAKKHCVEGSNDVLFRFE